MSLLAIQIPPRVRPPARAAGDAVPATEFDYVLSANGRAVTGTGRATPSRMPKADSVVAVLSDADVAWHLVTMPKSPASRVRRARISTAPGKPCKAPSGHASTRSSRPVRCT